MAGNRYVEAPIGLCCFDTRLRYISINNWLAALNGLSVESHLGRSVSELFPKLAAKIESQLRSVLDTGEPILGGFAVTETPARPSVKRYFQHNYVAVRSDDGTIIEVCCSVEEITGGEREAAIAMKERLSILTKKERTVLKFLASGKLNKQIAIILDVSLRTVEYRRKRILRKLGIKSFAELVRFAVEAESI